MDYSPWGRKESDTTEQLHFHFQTQSILMVLWFFILQNISHALTLNKYHCKYQVISTITYL